MKLHFLEPVLFKEFAVQLRGSRAALLLTVFVGLTIIAARLLYGAITSQLDRGTLLLSAQIGQVLFIGLSLGVQALVTFLAPATTVNAMSSEYERRTFDMLLMTPISATQLLFGKLIASLSFLILMVLASLPVFSAVALFGGVELNDIGRVVGTLLMTAIVGGMFGLFCSALTRQTYSATLLCFAILVSVIGGTLFAANVWALINGLTPAPPALVVGNPLSAMASALAPVRPPETSLTGGLRPLVMLGLLTRGVLDLGVQEGLAPLHRAASVIYIGLTIILFWLTIHIVQPRRRWRLTIADAAMLTFVVGYGLLAFWSRSWWLPGFIRSVS